MPLWTGKFLFVTQSPLWTGKFLFVMQSDKLSQLQVFYCTYEMWTIDGEVLKSKKSSINLQTEDGG